MNFDNDLNYRPSDGHGVTRRQFNRMTYIRYSLIVEGRELLIPLRWRMFHNYDDSTVIEAVIDRPIGNVTELSVSFYYATHTTSVELVTSYGSTRHMSWDSSPYLRVDLRRAVKFLMSFAPNHGELSAWVVWEKNIREMETL